MPEAARPGIGGAIIFPALIAGIVLGVLGLWLSLFLGDMRIPSIGLVVAGLAFTGARVLGHIDRPRGHGLFARHVLTGLAAGLMGWAILRAIFVQGPALWLVLGGFGAGLYRAHRALLKRARDEPDDGARWARIFHPRDVQALAVLLVGYALVGVSGFMVLRAFAGFLPMSGQILLLATVVYILRGARLLIGFAAEERGAAGAGIIPWLKANALQLAIVLILLTAYAAFRARLATSVPFFPLVEFGLGVAAFGFALARLRSRMRRDGSALATASQARDHERVIAELREGAYDEVARPVTRFIESGTGKDEYARTLLASVPEDDPRGEALRTRIAAHREPPRAPPIAIEWSFAAGGAMSVGLATAALVLALRVFHAEMPYPLLLALLFLAFGAYAQQDIARAHHRPWQALGIACAGVALLFLDVLLFIGAVSSLAAVPGAVWGVIAVVAALMIGIPGLSAYRQHKRLQEGLVVDARRLSLPLELQQDLQKARKRAATSALTAFIILLPAPWAAGWLAERGIIPEGFPAFFDDILGVAIWVAVAFGAAALVRFYGLTRGRAGVLAREREKRDRRLHLHRTMMQSIERS